MSVKSQKNTTVIVRKNEKLEIGDKVLCMTEGYAFMYKEENE